MLFGSTAATSAAMTALFTSLENGELHKYINGNPSKNINNLEFIRIIQQL